MAFSIKQNDTSPSLQATLRTSSQSAVNLDGASVKFHMNSIDGTTKVDSSMTVVDASNGVIRYDWLAGDTDTSGTYYVEFEVTYSDSSVETFPNDGYAVLNVVRELR